MNIPFDWWMRDALRQASAHETIRRSWRTKRGVETLVKLGLLVVVKRSEFNTTYAITDLGRQLVPQLPTAVQEYEEMFTDKYRNFEVQL